MGGYSLNDDSGKSTVSHSEMTGKYTSKVHNGDDSESSGTGNSSSEDKGKKQMVGVFEVVGQKFDCITVYILCQNNYRMAKKR